MSVTVTLDQGAIDRLLRRRTGTAYRRLATRTNRVARIAAAQAPGHMGEFIDWEIRQGPKGLSGVIWCNHPAVHFVLRGTRPHPIRPRREFSNSRTRNGKRRRAMLRFEIGGEVLYRREVFHPGTTANPFMQRALRLGR